MPQRPVLRRDHKVWASLLVSLALHLLVAYMALHHGTPEPAPVLWRTRLPSPPRFTPDRLAVAPRAEPAPVQMEYLPAPPFPVDVEPSLHALLPPATHLEQLGEIPLVLPERVDEYRSFEFGMAPVDMIRPAQMGLVDTLSDPTLDLLGFADRARAMKDHAVVVVDPARRRNLTGYINFALVHLPMGSSRGIPVHILASYMNRHTQLLVGVQPKPYEYFLSPDLLKDPILFMTGYGYPEVDDDLLHRELLRHMRDDELAGLAHYLRSGGFLYVEGHNRYLRAMIGALREVLQGDGRLLELGPSHPIYHSFYSFPVGFPGEYKSGFGDEEYRDWNWDYPGRVPGVAVAGLATGVRAAESGVPDMSGSLPRALGLWGLELDDELVAVFNDLPMSGDWGGYWDSDRPMSDRPVVPSLRAGINIVVYALTRRRSLAVREPPPHWMRLEHRPMLAPERETAAPFLSAEAELLATLDASLAIVRAPLGQPLDGTLVVKLNGRQVLESAHPASHGLLLHNLPAGPIHLELDYGGQRRQLQIDLEGGYVSTLTVSIDRVAWIRRLRVRPLGKARPITPWPEEFADLSLEESNLSRMQGVPAGEPRF